MILVHGNGPQVGILALMEQDYSARTGVSAYTLDCLGAETQGQIGYVLSSAILNVPGNEGAATIVTEVLVDKNDAAFEDPTKPVGATYTQEEAEEKASSLGWTVKQDGDKWRRVVPSPAPKSILQIEQIKALLGASPGLVICCGGGGVPMIDNGDGTLSGVEAVIDKDLCSALLAEQLGADGLIILVRAQLRQSRVVVVGCAALCLLLLSCCSAAPGRMYVAFRVYMYVACRRMAVAFGKTLASQRRVRCLLRLQSTWPQQKPARSSPEAWQ